MAESNTLIFYDIDSLVKPKSFAPNPAKSRLALSVKNVPFNTEWVELGDITETRKKLKCPAVRKRADGSDYYTLPILRDPASGNIIGDSYEIAVWLEDNYPNSGGHLFPSHFTGEEYESPKIDEPIYVPLTPLDGAKHQNYAHFNIQVDTTFSAFVGLVASGMPLKREVYEGLQDRLKDVSKSDAPVQMDIGGEKRKQLMTDFKDGLESLAKYFQKIDGPYLNGQQATYADMIVGGWLIMMSESMPKVSADEWEDFKTWHGGVFDRLLNALIKDCYKCI
ncbi:hypothetical protein K470DRAFT_255128 [Piedraia hortae CBS 480.64]|uniref:Uncharacterized protein n=1 Tax=Piedraia hortae CBS 480.64 TaxID=1314780 RepID=A0A6A7C780_9PEZI|nr:hypothetical protein K470DRAFT_255128 [Piedraia hortae CBS 480.64]